VLFFLLVVLRRDPASLHTCCQNYLRDLQLSARNDSVGDVKKNMTLFGGIIKDCHRDRVGENSKIRVITSRYNCNIRLPSHSICRSHESEKRTSEREIWSKQERKSLFKSSWWTGEIIISEDIIRTWCGTRGNQLSWALQELKKCLNDMSCVSKK